jgi:hypothetical protein
MTLTIEDKENLWRQSFNRWKDAYADYNKTTGTSKAFPILDRMVCASESQLCWFYAQYKTSGITFTFNECDCWEG